TRSNISSTGVTHFKDGGGGQERHSARRWRGDASVCADENRLQTTAANLRQADELLSARDSYARRSPRGADHFDAERFADARRLFGRRCATRYSHRVRTSAEAGRDRAGVSDRRKLYPELRRIPDSWRQHFLWKT